MTDRTARLDEETERLIEFYGDCCYYADDAVGLPSNKVAESQDALRIRIAQRCEESRKLGQDQILDHYRLARPCAVCTSTTEAP